MLEILEDLFVFLYEKIYISALYRRHKCVIQVKYSTSKVIGPEAHNIIYINTKRKNHFVIYKSIGKLPYFCVSWLRFSQHLKN